MQVSLTSEVRQAVAPLLELALVESHSQGAYLYYFDQQKRTAAAIAWAGLPLRAESEIRSATVSHHNRRTAPLVLHENSWSSQPFEVLPEFREHRFEGVVSVPLVDACQTIGMLNVCRLRPDPVKPSEFSFLLSLGTPIAGLLAASQARVKLTQEVQKLARQLLDRKILDRAKGLIQSRFAWTEEQAYFCIRNLSRRTRSPMRLIAEQIIQTGAAVIAAEEGAL
jgi:signal transduction protein with GAF and PtsI domain